MNTPKLPKSVLLRGNISLYVGTEEHREKLEKLLQLTDAPSASKAIWEAIDFYLKAKEKENKG